VDVGWVFGDIFFCVLVVGCNRLLGDKSPFTQQALLGDGADRDEEAARIQCNKFFFSLVAFCFGHTPNSISKKNSCDPIEE
jgi:hypothetical protein